MDPKVQLRRDNADSPLIDLRAKFEFDNLLNLRSSAIRISR